MNTDARRKASAAFHAKRTAEGWRKVTLWMHPDTIEELTRLAKAYGSKEAAASMCINHHSHRPVEPVAAKPAKLISAPVEAFSAAGVQFGPTPVAPGSRLKKPKGKA